MTFMLNSLQPPASSLQPPASLPKLHKSGQPFDPPPGWHCVKIGFEFEIAGYSKSDFTLLINVR